MASLEANKGSQHLLGVIRPLFEGAA